MNLKHFAHIQYKKYCQSEGCQYIVSEFALYKIIKIILDHDVKNVLEIGVGIGTISGSLIELAKIKKLDILFAGTESNDYCLNQINKNLGEHALKLKIFSEVAALPTNFNFDLIIVDGGEEGIRELKRMVKPNAIVLVEGDRKDQVEIIKNIFPKSLYASSVSLKMNGNYSVQQTQDYQGGLKILFIDPTLQQRLHWLQIKIETAVKYRIRSLLK